MINSLDEDETAMDEYLQATNTLTIKPLGDNPMDNTVTLSGRGNDIKRKYTAGEGRITVKGDPYAMFAKGPDHIPL